MITPADLARLADLHAAVTTERLGVLEDDLGAWVVAGVYRRVVVLFTPRFPLHREHARFFVTAQRALPLLIADIQTLREENEQLRKRLEEKAA